jgi:site-specific recombinase XerD
VLEFIRENKCTLHEETLRRSVRQIAKAAGIKKYVKFHTSRHTFCTRMLQLGFTIPEVADMAGDTIETISHTYAHVDRENIKKKVSALLG